MALVSLDVVYAWLGISEPTDQETALLTALKGYAETLIKEHVGYQVEQADDPYTQYLPGVAQPTGMQLIEGFEAWNGGTQIPVDWSKQFLRELPVRSVISVHVNAMAYGIEANWTSDHLRTEGRDFYLDRDGPLSKTGILYSINGNWPAIPRSVKVVYQAGYTPTELAKTNFPKAACLATAAAWQTALANQGGPAREGFGPMTREQIGLQLEAYYDIESVRSISGMFQKLPGEVRELLQTYRRYDL